MQRAAELGHAITANRIILTNKIRPRFAATSFDEFAIAVTHRPKTGSFVLSP
jgi:hypothetical protein